MDHDHERRERGPARTGASLGAVLLAGCLIWGSGCSILGREPVEAENLNWSSPDGATGRQLLTEHYDIRTTTRDTELMRWLPEFMEACYREYEALMPPARPAASRMVVYLFGTRNEWARFVSRQYPRQAHTYLHIHAGGFVDAASGDAVIHDIGRADTLSLLAHEGFHQYAYHCFDESLPAWLNEGLATQFEAFDMLRGTPPPKFDAMRNHMRKSSLRRAMNVQGGMIPLEDLLTMHAGQAVVETGLTVRAYYAQVWSMVLMMREGAGGKYENAFETLLADAGTERLRRAVETWRAENPDRATLSPGEIIFRHYITDDLGTFINDYDVFTRRLVN